MDEAARSNSINIVGKPTEQVGTPKTASRGEKSDATQTKLNPFFIEEEPSAPKTV